MRSLKHLFILFTVVFQSCTGQTEKINGLSFVASDEAISKKHINPVVNVNANYCAIMPFGFIRNLDNPNIVYNTNRQWFGETRAGVKQYIKLLKQEGIKIMLKPQIWVWRGEFTGFIKMNSEEDWKTLETSYSKFILEYADLAQELNIEILCIGTELEKFVEHRPQYWSDLIKDIKKLYKGKLTYAANWDEFKRTPFWESMDYIGVDAYFPVSDSKTPTVEQSLAGWTKHKTVIKSLSDKYNKPVLFTEYGYRSVDYTGKKPWDSDHTLKSINLEGQTNATKALFDSFWYEDWFAGGFIWKWFHNYEKSGGQNDNQFTPQNKPVEELIKRQYGE